MSYLIKWKLEKLLKRRDFGEIMRKQVYEITSKLHDMLEPLKRDGMSPRLKGFYSSYGEALKDWFSACNSYDYFLNLLFRASKSALIFAFCSSTFALRSSFSSARSFLRASRSSSASSSFA